MKIRELCDVAAPRGIKTTRMRKGDIIRAIQWDEGHFPCFGAAVDGYCDEWVCARRKDCLRESERYRPPE